MKKESVIMFGAIGAIASIAISSIKGSKNNKKSNKKKIQNMLDNMPEEWKIELDKARKEQKILGLNITPEKPTVDEVIETVLEITAGNKKIGSSRWAGKRGREIVPVNKEIQSEAMRGLEMSYREGYPSWKFIGIARGMQLATREKIWERSLKRIKRYLSTHKVDKKGKNFGNDENPSKGYMANLIWGGHPAEREWLQ